MSVELKRLPEVMETVRQSLQGAREGAMTVPIADLRVMLAGLRRADRALRDIEKAINDTNGRGAVHGIALQIIEGIVREVRDRG